MLLTYKALNGQGPDYLKELLILRELEPRRRLQSSSEMLLVEPRTELVSKGDRAFMKVAPRMWNALPSNIKTAQTVDAFKSKLKSYLFAKD